MAAAVSQYEPTHLLKVCNLPHKNLGKDNVVYLHASDFVDFDFQTTGPTRVQLNGDIVVEARAQQKVKQGHTAIERGYIGVGLLIRQSANLRVDGKVDVVPWYPPRTKNLNLMYIEFEIIPFNPKLYVQIKEADIVEIISKEFTKQTFCTGLTWYLELGGQHFKLVTGELQVASLDEDMKDNAIGYIVKRGFWTEQTQIVVRTNSRKAPGITLEVQEESQPMFDGDYSVSDKLEIGGLDTEVKSIFRRAFASRTLDAEVIDALGIKHVRGVLLYGPPGTGKTLIARQAKHFIGTKREPKLVNGPEILNKYVGQSEENIRMLFADAEAVQQGDKDANRPPDPKDVHVIIFDELDAICKQRGTSGGSTGVGDTVVNQLLSKMDGVDQLNNIVVIGMTNRKDMIDDALLRPGRFEVHIEIGLPDEQGRYEILQIHTKKLQKQQKLANDVDLKALAEVTKNFSGAELSGLIKSATSFAFYGKVDAEGKSMDVRHLKIKAEHFAKALEEVKPAFGSAEEDLAHSVRGGMIDYGKDFARVRETCMKMVKTVDHLPLQSVLLEGHSGSGMTAIAAQLGIDAQLPFTKMISPEDFVGWSEQARCSKIARVFNESYRSPASMIILDNIERLLSYVDIGPRFSNAVLQTLLVCIKRVPPLDQRTGVQRSLLIVGTTSSRDILEQMGVVGAFNVCLTVPRVTGEAEIRTVFRRSTNHITDTDLDLIVSRYTRPIGIKRLIMIMEMSAAKGAITYEEFRNVATDCGVSESLL